VFVAGANVLAILVVAGRLPAQLFATYTIGLAILALASAFADGGLATTITILGAQRGDQRETLERYRRAGVKHSYILVPASCVVVLVIIVAVSHTSTVVRVQDVPLLMSFALTGVVSARTSFSAALLYAVGRFGPYNLCQITPSLVRLILLGTAVLLLRRLELSLIAAILLASAVTGWGLAVWWVRTTQKTIRPSEAAPAQTDVNRAVSRFLWPLYAGVILGAIVGNINILGSSVFAAGVFIAVYGIFLRMNQVYAVFASPLNQFVSRSLRLTSTQGARLRKGFLYLAISVAVYGAYAGAALGLYVLLGRFISHYALRYPIQFGLFLVFEALGNTYASLDAILIAIVRPWYRIPGMLITGATTLVVLLVLRPKNLSQIILVDASGVAACLLYYWVVFLSAARQASMTKPERI
jgi:O-antigen/teichoic acid export membrane protein